MFKKPLSNLKTTGKCKLKQRVIVVYNISPEIGDILVPEGLVLGIRLPFITSPASVIPVLVGGADLMIPGVVQIPSSQTVVPPQLVANAQYIMDSPTTRGPPLAVGPGGKGKAVHLLHSWKDYLFTMGIKADPPGVVEIQEVAGTSAGGEQGRLSVAAQEVESIKPPVDPVPEPSVQQPRPAPQLSKEGETEVSSNLRNAVLQAICGTLKSIPTPSFLIPVSTFYSSYVLPYRPAFVHRNVPGKDSSATPSGNDGYIKHSTYKSLAAFLRILDKQGILTIKDMKLEPLVMSVSASHSGVMSHTSYVSLRDKQLKEEKREKREGEEKARVQEMEIKELWKPHTPSGSARFFMGGGVRAAVIKYVTTRQLDEVLLSTVAGKNESGDSLEFLKREGVVQRLSEKMQNWYEIRTEGQEPLLRKRQLKPISVVVKTRQGRRANMLISGFEPFLLEAEVMAEELRRICAVIMVATVSPLPGKPTRSEVLVQGKQTKAVVDFLLSKGVPKKWIETADLTVKK
ncbi:hypothetical protein EDC04DRAFT_2882850 [Pisolithus marmoratus]|nr:hypothetical protein EDC04DRAFT_2882850 [Pisolithus marmoratus]